MMGDCINILRHPLTLNHYTKMNIQNALIESANTQDSTRFRRLIDKLDGKGVPVTDLPIMVLNVNAVGLKAHEWAWDQIEDWQNS